MCTCVCMCVRVWVRVWVGACVCLCVCVCVCVGGWVWVCVCGWVCGCVGVWESVCETVCVRAYWPCCTCCNESGVIVCMMRQWYCKQRYTASLLVLVSSSYKCQQYSSYFSFTIVCSSFCLTRYAATLACELSKLITKHFLVMFYVSLFAAESAAFLNPLVVITQPAWLREGAT